MVFKLQRTSESPGMCGKKMTTTLRESCTISYHKETGKEKKD
jgi:hypothetical protein